MSVRSFMERHQIYLPVRYMPPDNPMKGVTDPDELLHQIVIMQYADVAGVYGDPFSVEDAIQDFARWEEWGSGDPGDSIDFTVWRSGDLYATLQIAWTQDGKPVPVVGKVNSNPLGLELPA